jgi:lactoylglutathione lyase
MWHLPRQSMRSLGSPGRVFYLGRGRVAGLSTLTERNWRILGVQQIAVGGLNKDALADFWVGKLGIPKVGTYRAEKENVDEDILQIGTGPSAVEIDIMEPINPDVAPKVHMPALNHIGLWVDNLRGAVAHLEADGVRMAPGGIRKGASGFDVAFIHPKSAQGVLVELVDAPDDVKAFYK